MKITKKNLSKIIKSFILESTQEKKNSLNSVLNNYRTVFYVDGAKQNYKLFRNKEIIKLGKVSTGAKGFGNKNNSGKTSTGLMEVLKIVGKGFEKGTVLVGLQKTSIVLGPDESGPRPGHPAEVLTRAITLTGKEDINSNVTSRSIYIHGTNREGRLGTKASGGCVRVSSDDAIELADNLLSPGDAVFVDPTGLEILSILGKEERVDEIKIDGKEATPEEALEILKKYPISKNA